MNLMKRITITPTIDALADDYRKEMLYKQPKGDIISSACKRLNQLIIEIKNEWLVPLEVKNSNGHQLYPARTQEDLIKYIEKIKTEYEILLVIHPSMFLNKIREFEYIIGTDEVSKIELDKRMDAQGMINPSKRQLFHELLVNAMRYDYVQRTIFPKYIRNLGIKTCVYCNSQYAITTDLNESLYQLDHCLPKSKYPYLSTSFFNLQPCCGTCNLRKSDNNMLHGNYFATIWREDSDPDSDFFHFYLKDGTLCKYLLSHKKEDLELEFVVKDRASDELRSLHKDYLDYFKINALYSEHKDVTEEVVWKKYVYSESYITSLRSAFNNLMGTDNVDIYRLIMGNYINEDDIYKRPLSKMIQDIAKQLHINLEPKDES